MSTGPYSYDLWSRADEVDSDAWRAACSAERNPYLGLGFLRAVELSFAREAQFWYAIFRDDQGRPVACACFSRYLVDGALMAPRFIRRINAAIRVVWPSYLKYKILLCGVPVSTCSNQLAIAANADAERILASLDALALKLARESGCTLVSFKEFAPPLSSRMDALKHHGFLRARSVVAYSLHGDHDSFGDYQSSRSKRHRAKIRQVFRKFESAGLVCEELRGRDGVDRLLTDDVHRLYLNVLDRAQVKFETIPAEFFRELARQLPDESYFTIIRKQDRIVGFCCALADGDEHNMLFCGLDYSLNAEADLYFNIIYRGLGQGLAPGVKVVHVGAGADEFKRRLGCVGESLAIYVKAVGAVRHFLLRQVFGLLFDTRSDLPSGAPKIVTENDGDPLPAASERAA